MISYLVFFKARIRSLSQTLKFSIGYCFVLAISRLLSLNFAFINLFKLVELKDSLSIPFSKSIIFKAWLIKPSIFCLACFQKYLNL